jgi:hypothetical protein
MTRPTDHGGAAAGQRWAGQTNHRVAPLVLALVAGGTLVLGGCSGGASSSSRGPSQRASKPRPTTSAPSSTSSTSSATPSTAPSSPAGGSVPAGFRAQSGSFVSADQGWVLGTAPCAKAPCTSVVRTSNDGATWVGIPAPADGLESPQSGTTPQSGVSEIRFADNLNGWVFGPDLWSTHDGGAVWSRVTTGPGAARVVDLETSGGSVYVVTQQCSPEASTCPGQLWRSTDASDVFQTVASFNLAPDGGSTLPVLAVHDTTGYLVTGTTSGGGETPGLLTSANGTTWSPEPDPCPAQLDETSIAPVDTVRAALLCSGEGAAGSTTKEILATSDGGHTWVPEGSPPPSGGDGGTLSAADVSTLAIATSSAATQIYRSVNGGATWTTPLFLDDGGEGWGDFGFTDDTHGFAIHAPIGRYQNLAPNTTSAGTGTLYITSNAGATWYPVVF